MSVTWPKSPQCLPDVSYMVRLQPEVVQSFVWLQRNCSFWLDKKTRCVLLLPFEMFCRYYSDNKSLGWWKQGLIKSIKSNLLFVCLFVLFQHHFFPKWPPMLKIFYFDSSAFKIRHPAPFFSFKTILRNSLNI